MESEEYNEYNEYKLVLDTGKTWLGRGWLKKKELSASLQFQIENASSTQSKTPTLVIKRPHGPGLYIFNWNNKSKANQFRFELLSEL